MARMGTRSGVRREIVFVIGTRAQLVKVAPVLLEAIDQSLDHCVWFTGQHRESINDLIEDFNLTSKFLMPRKYREHSSIISLLFWLPSTLWQCTAFLLSRTGTVGKKPMVVVHGDTLSTLLGALAARLAGSPVTHLESGLSSRKAFDPFPEELIRRLVFRLTNLAICPNDDAAARMRDYRCKVVHSGENTLLDSVRFAVERSIDSERLPVVYFVASLHRFSNIYSPRRLEHLVAQLIELSEVAPVFFVLHPATERKLTRTGLREKLCAAPGIRLIPRIPYTKFLSLISGAEMVVSDGGSNQEELSYLGIPTVLMRQRSERPDGIGANIIFESTLAGGLADYVSSGKSARTRTPTSLDSSIRPSITAIEAISNFDAS